MEFLPVVPVSPVGDVASAAGCWIDDSKRAGTKQTDPWDDEVPGEEEAGAEGGDIGQGKVDAGSDDDDDGVDTEESNSSEARVGPLPRRLFGRW